MINSATDARAARWRRGPVLACAAAALTAGLLACSDDGNDDPAAADKPTTAAEWTSLGKDLGHSRAATDETTVGPDNVADLAPAWQRDGIKGLTGTPVVSDGVVYFGDWTGHVRALDARTGDESWATDVESFYIGGSVGLDDERVYVATFDTRVVALDRETGEQVWETPRVGDHSQAAIFGSPTVVDGKVIVGVASYELMTGNLEPSFRGHVVALDAESGDELWRYWTVDESETGIAGVSIWGSASVDVDRGHVYVGTGNSYGPSPSPRSDGVVALDLETGKELWVTQFTEGDVWTTANPEGTDADVGAPPNFFRVGDTDALGVADKAGIYHVLSRDDGKVLWESELTEGGLMGGVQASAAVADGRVYVASNRASTDADLLALDTETGEVLWRTDVHGHAAGPVSWANGVVYLADDSGKIAAYDAEDGTELWKHAVDANAAGGIAIVDGTVYAGWGWWFAAPPEDPKGGLIAFRLDGKQAEEEAAAGSGDADADAPDGERIYQARCATCHGGTGQGGTGPSLLGVADRLPRDAHIAVVESGRDNMPGWTDTLSEEEIAAVVDYQREVLSPGDG
jgi:polyvinyl alcohol dehydrogenase (cytochrome)